MEMKVLKTSHNFQKHPEKVIKLSWQVFGIVSWTFWDVFKISSRLTWFFVPNMSWNFSRHLGIAEVLLSLSEGVQDNFKKCTGSLKTWELSGISLSWSFWDLSGTFSGYFQDVSYMLGLVWDVFRTFWDLSGTFSGYVQDVSYISELVWDVLRTFSVLVWDVFRICWGRFIRSRRWTWGSTGCVQV